MFTARDRSMTIAIAIATVYGIKFIDNERNTINIHRNQMQLFEKKKIIKINLKWN